MLPEVTRAPPISTSLLSCFSSLPPQLPDPDLKWPGRLGRAFSCLSLPSDLSPSSLPGRPAMLLLKSPTHPHFTQETIPGRPRKESYSSTVRAQQIGGRAKIRTPGS